MRRVRRWYSNAVEKEWSPGSEIGRVSGHAV